MEICNLSYKRVYFSYVSEWTQKKMSQFYKIIELNLIQNIFVHYYFNLF